jgi:D-alanyl-D-alanine dipeptidase
VSAYTRLHTLPSTVTRVDRVPIVLMGDPQVAGVPVRECGEPLVSADANFAMSQLKEDVDPARRLVRVGVHERLLDAGQMLPEGFRLCWVEGYRDASLQHRYFEEYRAVLAQDHADLTDEQCALLASRYVSPPAVAPHVSGAAIDLTLCDEQGTELDLGTPVNASPEESGGRCYSDAEVGSEARHYRNVLAAALSGAGLVNYPTEWWHWSYGDRYWALLTGADEALYGPVVPS